jgi:hypothetical protein
VGPVVVDHTVSDTEPSAVYDNGMEGFGGTITMAAFAHPEGKRVATITFKCVAPIVAFESDGLQYGNTCSGSKASRLSYGAELTGAVLPIGQNVDTKTTEAMEELAAKYVDRLGQPIAEDAPSLTGRRVLQYSGRQKGEEPATWNAWQHEAHIPAESMARSVDEVGLLILRLTRWEATPSHTYEGGQPGFEGTVEMVAVALPEGVVVGVFRPDCTINTQRQMDLLEGLVDDSKCASDPALTLDYVTRMLQ